MGSAPQLENHWIKQFGENDIKHMKLDNLRFFNLCVYSIKSSLRVHPSIGCFVFFLLIQFRVGRGLESIPVTAKKAGYTSDRSPVNHRARDRQTFMLKFPPRAKYEFSFNLTLVCVWTVKGSWSTIREPNASMAKTCKPHT